MWKFSFGMFLLSLVVGCDSSRTTPPPPTKPQVNVDARPGADIVLPDRASRPRANDDKVNVDVGPVHVEADGKNAAERREDRRERREEIREERREEAAKTPVP